MSLGDLLELADERRPRRRPPRSRRSHLASRAACSLDGAVTVTEMIWVFGLAPTFVRFRRSSASAPTCAAAAWNSDLVPMARAALSAARSRAAPSRVVAVLRTETSASALGRVATPTRPPATAPRMASRRGTKAHRRTAWSTERPHGSTGVAVVDMVVSRSDGGECGPLGRLLGPQPVDQPAGREVDVGVAAAPGPGARRRAAGSLRPLPSEAGPPLPSRRPARPARTCRTRRARPARCRRAGPAWRWPPPRPSAPRPARSPRR